MPDQQYHILYAEDEISNRELLEIKLNKAGFAFTGARDGQQAWDIFQKNHFDLVILDHYMPGMDGLDVAKLIKAKSPQTPIISITSNDNLTKTLLAAGYDAVLIKPIRGNSVVETINKLLVKK
ncbi:response regulator [bacterium]|nr:response regulator [bacterium]